MFESQLPVYMLMGMSIDEYWNGDPNLCTFYHKSYRLRMEQENFSLWMQGLYIREAILSSFDNKAKYPKEPYRILEPTAEERKAKEAEERQKTIDFLNGLKAAWDKRGKNNG